MILFLFGCYGPKRAQKAIDKAYEKQPEVVALNASKLFPVKSDTIEFIRWRKEVEDSINVIHDSLPCPEKIRKVTFIKEMIRQAPPVYRIDSAVLYVYENRINTISKDRDKFKKRFSFFWKAFALSILIFLLFLAYLFKRR